MRISRGTLLVILAILVPFIVEFRTVAAYFGIGLTIRETLLIALAVVSIVLVWALLPESNNSSGSCQK